MRKARWGFVQDNSRLLRSLSSPNSFPCPNDNFFFFFRFLMTLPSSRLPFSVSRPFCSQFCVPVVTTFKSPRLESKIQEVKVDRHVGSTPDRVKGQ
jgi:hypothetical protein